MTMTEQIKINDDNAESIGRPIFDRIIRSFQNEKRQDLIQHFPYLDKWMTVEIFDEAVAVLNRLGELVSSEYSTRLTKGDNHVLAWDVDYKNDNNPVRWNLYLNDNQEEIKVNGFEFDR